ncbi:MAG: hypothetical protein NVS4B11_01460 [Ktedonobacteraceae bacterium]
MQDVQATLSVGSVVKNRYIVEDLLGKGGFGAVYRVRDQRVIGNLFALKEVIDPNKEERERFAFECEVLKRLDHLALPRVYRVFEDNKNIRVYMLMDYVAGPNLEILRQRQPGKHFPVPRVMEIMGPIMDAVGYLHQQQPPIIHRDIKPANIIVPDSDDGSVLVDFGIAKEYEQDSTTTAVRRCSPGYGAPEQYAHGTNPRTDIYGLAATFYVLLTGIIPTDALYRLTQMGSKNTDPLEPVQQLAPHVPQHIADAIHRAMAINSNERFATVKEFWQALNAQPIAEPSVSIVPVTPLQRIEDIPTKSLASAHGIAPYTAVSRSTEVTRTRRRGVLLTLFALLALLALIVGVTLGTSFFKGFHFGQAASIATPLPKATPGITVTSKPTPTSTTATATPHTTPNPTVSPPSAYPVVNNLYSGSVTDTLTTPYTTAPITLRNITQNNANISGYLDIAPGHGLQGSGYFTGTVSTNRTIQFTVNGYAGNDPLAFTGTIQLNGSIASGTYCAVNKGSCDNSQGHGTWAASPVSSSSIISAHNDAYIAPVNCDILHSATQNIPYLLMRKR